MDKIIEKAKELKKELNEVPLFKEYQKVKELYQSSNEIRDLEKEIVRSKNEGRKEDHQKLLDELHNHPLYINYHNLESEVVEYLKEISSILNK